MTLDFRAPAHLDSSILLKMGRLLLLRWALRALIRVQSRGKKRFKF